MPNLRDRMPTRHELLFLIGSVSMRHVVIAFGLGFFSALTVFYCVPEAQSFVTRAASLTDAAM